MHQFHRYDPAQPRTVTSFKGNQKLIFEGYRYNIHHIVPAKGVKTWRCVCAKKLNGSRSWCKGRAETWDGDSQGVSKGEHNHPAEHEVAELEFFRSQLILAAISSPQANLNDLIDEATALMSVGVNFGSRESLKKSLTGARKQAENGGFKLKCYKSSDKPIKNLAYNKLVRQPPTALNNGQKGSKEGKGEADNKGGGGGMKTSGNVLQLLALAKEAAGNKQTPNGRLNGSLSTPFGSPASLLDSSGFHSASSTFSSSPNGGDVQPNNTSLLMTMMAAAAAALGNANLGGKRGNESKQQENGRPAAFVPQQQNSQIMQRKKARVNSIFNRLSTKAAAAAASSSSCSSELASSTSGHSSPTRETKREELKEEEEEESLEEEVADEGQRKKAFAATGTQTEGEEEVGGGGRGGMPLLHSLADGGEDCKCRVVRVCCCGNGAKCTGGRKRKWADEAHAGIEANGGEEKGKEDQEEEEEAGGGEHRQGSAPPSSCSSVENQPNNQHLMSPAKEGTEQ